LFCKQKNESQFDHVTKLILKSRKKKEEDGKSLRERNGLISAHKTYRPEKQSEYSNDDHFKYVTDLANTFMNHLEFLEEIIHDKNEDSNENQIRIDDNYKKPMKKLINIYDKMFPISNLGKYESAKWFVENYGNRYDRTKASRKTTKPKTKGHKDLELVKECCLKVFQAKLSPTIQEIISDVRKMTGMSEAKIKEIISSNPDEFDFYKSGNDLFGKKFLAVAVNGKKHGEFEDMTRKIFRSFGLPTDKITVKVGPTNKLEIDGFVQNFPQSGIIDSKSGKKFSCSNKEVGIMKDYIKNFKKYRHKGKYYKLGFFAYIYGNKFDNKNNFRRIIRESGTPGAVISAHELLKLKERFDAKKISGEKIWKLFKKNDEINSFDY